MARRVLIVTGDKKLTRQLNSLAKTTASKLNRSAMRPAAKLVLEEARSLVPVQSGAFRRSLTVRALPRSRKRTGYRVTQREISRTSKDKAKAFYGAYLELGYRATGRPRRHGRYAKNKIPDVGPSESMSDKVNQEFSERRARTLAKQITTYRKTDFTVRQLRAARKIEGRWLIRQAGKNKEQAAQDLYVSKLKELIDNV